MKALLHQPFYETLIPRPEFERPPEVLPRQHPRRTLSWQITLSYPSPPMSSPPSPERKPEETLLTSSNVSVGNTVATSDVPRPSNVTAVCLPPILGGLSAPTPHPSQQPFTGGSQPASSAAQPPQFGPRTTSAPDDGLAPLARTESTPSAGGVLDIQATSGPSASTLSTGPGRGGRRSKSHVANACNNCKRAHLSCDVERPCNRCVQTGKGDTCRDVPHKKRGRPRLRDESDFKLQELGSAVPPAESREAGTVSIAGRVMATARHRRTSSLRTLRSFPEASGLPPGSMGGAQSSLGPAFAPQPRVPRPASGFVTPIAFLDLDLVIMKANASFQSLMGVQDIRGLRLTDIARALDGDSFQNTRNALRAEREAKEPSYLPPILQPGLDPVSGITDQNIEEITRGFDVQVYTWIFRLAGGVERSLEVRVRLAKTSLYFVTLSLPPLQESQTEQRLLPGPGPLPSLHQQAHTTVPPPLFQSSPPQFSDPQSSRREQVLRATPPSHFHHSQQPVHGQAFSTPTSHLSSRPYQSFEQSSRFQQGPPPPQYHPSAYQNIQAPPPGPPPQAIQVRMPTGDSSSVGSAPSPLIPPSSYMQSLTSTRPRSDTLDSSHFSPFTPTRPRSETLESLGRHMQSRLRADSGVTTTTSALQSSPSQQPSGERSRTSSDESNGATQGQSPRKRRRMNLDEVLHRR